MENGPFEDVFPIENGDIPAIAMLVFQEGNCFISFCNTKKHRHWWLVSRFVSSWPLTPFDAGSQAWRHGGFFSAGVWGKVPICFWEILQLVDFNRYLYIYIHMYLWYVCKYIYIVLMIYIYIYVCVFYFFEGGCNYFDVCSPKVLVNKHDDNLNF